MLRGGRALAGEQFVEAGGMGFEQGDTPEAANHALAVLGSAVGLALSIGFLQPEVLAGVPSEARTVTLRRNMGWTSGVSSQL